MVEKFLINTITAWEEPPRARHQLAFSLAKNHQVIFVTRNKTGLPNIREYHPQKNIKVIEPVFPIDYKYRYRLPAINELYQRWLFRWLKKNISFDHCINFDFTAHYISNFFKNAIYYCNDDYIGNSKYPVWIINKYHQRCESIVIKNALFCIVTATFLENKLKRINRNTFLIPLGAPDLKDINVIPKQTTDTGKITVSLMYVGTRKLDHNLLNDLLLKGDVNIVCIGPRDNEFERKIISNDNISFKGVLKGDDLYQEINKADVGIAPYDLQKSNKGVTPNKLWQYFAVGKPMVISDIPNLAYFDFPDKFVYVYKSNSECYTLIKKAHLENNSLLIESRSKFAESNSWDKRADKFLSIAGDFSDHNPV